MNLSDLPNDHRLAVERARTEFPEAREQVRRAYEARRWYRYWDKHHEGHTTHGVARAVGSVDRGS